jgi:hypothetical protein
MLTLVLWQHVVCYVCVSVSRTVFRMCLVMVVCRMLCSVSLNYSFSKEQCMLPEDDRAIETCRSVLNVLM